MDLQLDDVLTKEKSYIFETKLSRAKECQECGNQCMKEKQLDQAVRFYERGLYHVEFDEGSWAFELMDQHRAMVNEVRLPIYLNLASCYLQSPEAQESTNLPSNVSKALKHSAAALEIDSMNVKALYRHAQALFHSGNYTQARTVLLRAAKQNPQDRIIRKLLDDIQHELREGRKEEKKLWTNAFRNSSRDPRSTEDAVKQPSIGTDHRVLWFLSIVGVLLVAFGIQAQAQLQSS